MKRIPWLRAATMLAAIAGATGSAWCFQTPGASGNPGDGDYDLMDLDCATSPMPSADVAAAVAAVKQINEEAGGQLEEDLLLGKIQLVVYTIPDVPGAAGSGTFGYHDWNTIGVNASAPADLVAYTLLHEQVHCGMSDSPGIGGTGHDARSTNPCFPCIHANMTATTILNLAEDICQNFALPPTVLAQLCQVMNQLREEVEADRAKHCPGTVPESYCVNPPSAIPLPSSCPSCQLYGYPF